jgi:hypothetical protein
MKLEDIRSVKMESNINVRGPERVLNLIQSEFGEVIVSYLILIIADALLDDTPLINGVIKHWYWC